MGFVERMKWWQWTALSLGLGALLGYLNSSGANPPIEHSSVSPMVFETGLMQPPYADPTHSAHLEPLVRGIVVHPIQEIRLGGKMAQVQLVTFDALDPHSPGHPSGAYQRVSMFAPYPYEPQPRHEPNEDQSGWPAASIYYGQSGDTIESLAARFYHKSTAQGVRAIIAANDTLRSASNASELKIIEDHAYWIPWDPADRHTISDFLLAANKLILQQQGPGAIPVSFRYTWWESANHAFAIWMTGSFLLVGVIWPTLLQVMVKGGLGRTKPEEFDLSRYKPAPVSPGIAKPTKAVTKDDMQQLREMEESLEASLRASAQAGCPAAEPQTQPAAPAIKVLAGAEPAAVLPQAPEEPKEYQGEFYPVVRPVEKKTD